MFCLILSSVINAGVSITSLISVNPHLYVVNVLQLNTVPKTVRPLNINVLTVYAMVSKISLTPHTLINVLVSNNVHLLLPDFMYVNHTSISVETLKKPRIQQITFT